MRESRAYCEELRWENQVVPRPVGQAPSFESEIARNLPFAGGLGAKCNGHGNGTIPLAYIAIVEREGGAEVRQ